MAVTQALAPMERPTYAAREAALPDAWPARILDECSTIARVAAGASLARFGNDELYLMQARPGRLEPRNLVLAAELRAILRTPPPGLVVGIPTLDPRGPKYQGWQRRIPGFLPLFGTHHQYGSAFISRTDSAPWIDTAAYVKQVCALWRNKRVALVCTDDNAMLTAINSTAKKFYWIPCPAREAFAQVDVLEAAVVKRRPDMAVLCCGPTATCLAARLARHGLQAVDVGSMGPLLLRHLRCSGPPRYASTLRHPHATDAGQVYQLLTAAGFTVYHVSEVSHGD